MEPLAEAPRDMVMPYRSRKNAWSTRESQLADTPYPTAAGEASKAERTFAATLGGILVGCLELWRGTKALGPPAFHAAI